MEKSCKNKAEVKRHRSGGRRGHKRHSDWEATDHHHQEEGRHAGSHGGAWKVAYADFVTAMMSLFIVLWLMGSSSKVKQAVAGYFNDPKGTGSLLARR